MFDNPFYLSNHIRETLILQVEESGARTLSWNLSEFDKIGGYNTLRTVWASLKSEERTLGVKRSASVLMANRSGDDKDTGENMKFCMSLGLSGTCSRLE